VAAVLVRQCTRSHGAGSQVVCVCVDLGNATVCQCNRHYRSCDYAECWQLPCDQCRRAVQGNTTNCTPIAYPVSTATELSEPVGSGTVQPILCRAASTPAIFCASASLFILGDELRLAEQVYARTGTAQVYRSHSTALVGTLQLAPSVSQVACGG
jgi:hypothetical protein